MILIQFKSKQDGHSLKLCLIINHHIFMSCDLI